MDFLLAGILAITWKQCIMYFLGALLIYLAIRHGFEPALLLPMGSRVTDQNQSLRLYL